jgi:hypothetical protein
MPRGVGRPGEVEQVSTFGILSCSARAMASSAASETPPCSSAYTRTNQADSPQCAHGTAEEPEHQLPLRSFLASCVR